MSQPKTPDNTPVPDPVPDPIGGDTMLPVPDENRDSVPDGSIGQPDKVMQSPVKLGPNDKGMVDSMKVKF